MIRSGNRDYWKILVFSSYTVKQGLKHKNQTNVETNEMKELKKIVGKTKIDIVRSQQIRESCDIQPINEWVERRRRRE